MPALLTSAAPSIPVPSTATLQQLILDLSAPPAPRFANFVTGANREALSALSAWSRDALEERFIYLWGEAGCGKTHLLHATLDEAAEQGFETRFLRDDLLLEVEADAVPHDARVAVDDVTQLSDAQQIAVFYLYNRLKDGGGALIASGPLPPTQLSLRPELTSRLGWGLTYRVSPLSDIDKTAALQRHARERGLMLAPEVCDYLLTHYRRDLPSLLAMLDALDRLSLARKRPITLPLVKTVLAENL